MPLAPASCVAGKAVRLVREGGFFMSYKIICDNCGATAPIETESRWPMPANWEIVPLSGHDGKPIQHHCSECVDVKEWARWDIHSQISRAQEAALAARKAKV